MKLEMDTVIIPEMRSVILPKRAVEISEGHSRNFRSTQKIRRKWLTASVYIKVNAAFTCP